MIRLLVVDDAADSRELVRTLLAGRAGIEIVGEAADGQEAVELAQALEPDVILMDVEMPGVDGVAATRRVRELCRAARIVAFAGSDDTRVVMAMMEAGASAYCVKGVCAWELERAIIGAGDPLDRLAHALARCLGETVKAELVARELADLTGADLAAVHLLSPTAGLGAASSAGPRAGGVTEVAFDAARRAFGRREPVRGAGVFALPLLADGASLGALVVAGVSEEALDIRLLASVADLAAVALVNERKLALSRAEACRDALTGLANRRAFDERLDEAIAGGGSVGLALLDLDDFKRVNDTRGHEAGDDVLRRVAVVLRRSVRADEGVFRVGGEEFAVLVGGGRDAALRVAQRVREDLLRDRRGQPLPTISAGIAALPDDATSRGELLRRADAALYAAKWAGKNRVLAYGAAAATPGLLERRRRRILLVDDDAPLRTLLRTTVETLDVELDEAADAHAAAASIRARPPDVVVLDVRLPGLDGVSFCRRLKSQPETDGIGVVLLTGSEGEDAALAAREAGADAFLRKPFSPLELLAVVQQLLGKDERLPVRASGEERGSDQVLLYAEDLGRLLEIERGQRTLLQNAYRATVSALAAALESKDTGTRAHSERVRL